MDEVGVERRSSDRRSSRGGGRRLTDRPSRSDRVPACPACHKTDTALIAGEADGGWWFVCLVCDHLWDQRQQFVSAGLEPPLRDDSRLAAASSAARAIALFAALKWW
jgi:hypothetical protein